MSRRWPSLLVVIALAVMSFGSQLQAQEPDLQVCDGPILRVLEDNLPGVVWYELEVEVDEDVTIGDLQVYLKWDGYAGRSVALTSPSETCVRLMPANGVCRDCVAYC